MIRWMHSNTAMDRLRACLVCGQSEMVCSSSKLAPDEGTRSSMQGAEVGALFLVAVAPAAVASAAAAGVACWQVGSRKAYKLSLISSGCLQGCLSLHKEKLESPPSRSEGLPARPSVLLNQFSEGLEAAIFSPWYGVGDGNNGWTVGMLI